MGTRITLAPSLVFLTAFFLYLGYGRVWAATLLAAAIHECGHLTAMGIAGSPATAIHLRLAGAVIESPPMGYGREMICAAAGPAASLLLAALLWNDARWELPGRISGGLCLFNLLPVYPLDGGRILRAALAMGTELPTAERITRAVGLAVSASAMGLSLWLAATEPGFLPVAAVAAMLLRTAGNCLLPVSMIQ